MTLFVRLRIFFLFHLPRLVIIIIPRNIPAIPPLIRAARLPGANESKAIIPITINGGTIIIDLVTIVALSISNGCMTVIELFFFETLDAPSSETRNAIILLRNSASSRGLILNWTLHVSACVIAVSYTHLTLPTILRV